MFYLAATALSYIVVIVSTKCTLPILFSALCIYCVLSAYRSSSQNQNKFVEMYVLMCFDLFTVISILILSKVKH